MPVAIGSGLGSGLGLGSGAAKGLDLVALALCMGLYLGGTGPGHSLLLVSVNAPSIMSLCTAHFR